MNQKLLAITLLLAVLLLAACGTAPVPPAAIAPAITTIQPTTVPTPSALERYTSNAPDPEGLTTNPPTILDPKLGPLPGEIIRGNDGILTVRLTEADADHPDTNGTKYYLEAFCSITEATGVAIEVPDGYVGIIGAAKLDGEDSLLKVFGPGRSLHRVENGFIAILAEGWVIEATQDWMIAPGFARLDLGAYVYAK